MSYVINWTLITDEIEGPLAPYESDAEHLGRFRVSQFPGSEVDAEFLSVGYYAGGYKVMENEVWLCAMNGGDRGHILDQIANLQDWDYPERAVCVVQEQEGPAHVYMLEPAGRGGYRWVRHNASG